MTPEQLAENLADYLLTRTRPWPDEAAMREAVCLTVQLMLTEARHETLQVLQLDQGG